MQHDNSTLRLVASGLAFVRPYIEAALPPGVALTPDDGDNNAADITNNAGDATTAADYTAVLCRPDEAGAMAARHPGAAVLAADGVIGTGMTGWPMELAARVWRGTFFHVPGSEVAVSAVHAVDLANAVCLTLGQPGIYTVTDGAAHSLDELADALAVRLGNKRILTARPALARWLPGHGFRRRMAAAAVADGSDFIGRFGFSPNNVSTYLRTHVYDETSL